MEASRAERGGYLVLSRLTLGELFGCVAAAIFAVSLFLPWYATSAANARNSELTIASGEVVRGGDAVTAWQMFPILRWILLAAVIAPFVLSWIVARGHKLEWKPGEVTMIVGIIAFVLVLCNGIILGKPGESVDISLQWGYPIALLASLGMGVSGFIRQSRHSTGRKPPGTL